MQHFRLVNPYLEYNWLFSITITHYLNTPVFVVITFGKHLISSPKNQSVHPKTVQFTPKPIHTRRCINLWRIQIISETLSWNLYSLYKASIAIFCFHIIHENNIKYVQQFNLLYCNGKEYVSSIYLYDQSDVDTSKLMY